MEILEKRLEDLPKKEHFEKIHDKPDTSLYEGLVLIEETSFSGPTSIKYWM